MMVYVFSPSILEVEAGEFEASLVYIASSRQLGLHRETSCQKNKK